MSKSKSSFGSGQNKVSLPRLANAQKVPWTRFRYWLLCDSWALEYASLSLAMACLLGVFSTLLHFDNKALLDWHSDLSINTVLSILATAAKSATLLATASALGQLKWAWYNHEERSLQDFQAFDDASRGPFGAFLLLLRLRRVSLASLGALITILTLPFDAFVQGSASQPLRLQQLPGAFIPVCTDYKVVVNNGYDIAPLMKGAVYSGIFEAEDKTKALFPNITDNAINSTAGSVISPSCSTGNCTFPTYHSLAVQHQCSNVSDMIQTAFLNPAQTQWISYIDYVASSTDPDSTDSLSWNLTATMQTSAQNTTDVPITLLNITDIFNISKYDSLEATNLLLSDVYILATGTQLEPVQAFHCSLSLGMQVYESSVENGVLFETPTEFVSGNWTQSSHTSPGDGYWSMTADVSGTQRAVRINYSAWNAIYGYLQEDENDAPFHGAVCSNCAVAYTNDVVYALWTTYNIGGPGSIDSTFESLATSMTKYFRVATTAVAEGNALALESYIHVRWGFLILPLVVVISACFFVLAASWQSRRLGIPSWRSNILAAIYSEHCGDSTAADATEPDCLETSLGPPRDYDRVSHLHEWAAVRRAGLRRQYAPLPSTRCPAPPAQEASPVSAERSRTARWI